VLSFAENVETTVEDNQISHNKVSTSSRSTPKPWASGCKTKTKAKARTRAKRFDLNPLPHGDADPHGDANRHTIFKRKN